MNVARDTAFYWREFDAALRPMLGGVVVLAAAAAAALTLTLTGAGRQDPEHPVQCGPCGQPMELLVKPAPARRTP